MIKEPRDIAVARFIVEDTRYILDAAPFLQSEKDVGGDGISLVTLPICMPYIRFGKTDAGWAGRRGWRNVEDLLTRVPFGNRYSVGMSDNVPPDADFEQRSDDLGNSERALRHGR